MIKVTKEMTLRYHKYPRPGKIEIVPTKPYTSQLDLSLAYSPGVAYPCEAIKEDQAKVYDYTDKGNLIGVVSNCTAVLGLGDIGPEAGKPVMEGKALLFKIFAGLDAFDIEINERNPDKLVEIIKSMAPTFGGINLEDIKAPECFEVERRLKEECDIPVMHDDQHGTAIISAAGLINALELQGKRIEDIRLVVNGAGAAAISCTRLYCRLGVRHENIVMCDSKGVIRLDRENLGEIKREFATSRDIYTLAQAMDGADVFLGLSVADVLTPSMLLSMAPRPIVFALANPNSEIDYELAKSTRPDVIVATGRSDFPNQINNVIGFPYIFRGALDCRATAINEEMKIGAVRAIAQLAKEEVPRMVDMAYGENHLHFGPDYILPKALDPRLLTVVAPAVARAAAESGVAKMPIEDYDEYDARLEAMIGRDTKIMRRIIDLARCNPKRVVFSQGDSENVIRAASRLLDDRICIPVLIGDAEHIGRCAREWNLNIDGMRIVSPHSEIAAPMRHRYAEMLFGKMHREGMTLQEARSKMHDNTWYGMMMVEAGDADAFLGSSYSSARELSEIARKVVGVREGMTSFATMHIVSAKKGTYFFADTAVNPAGDVDTLVTTARLVDQAVRFFGETPVLAMLSYSSFGSDMGQTSTAGSPGCVAQAVSEIHKKYPEITVDGEMQANYAFDNALRDMIFPFNKLYGKKVNTLVFPDLNAASICYKMVQSMGAATIIGPIEMGLNKPVHFINSSADVSEIVHLAAIAAVDAAAQSSSSDGCRMGHHK